MVAQIKFLHSKPDIWCPALAPVPQMQAIPVSGLTFSGPLCSAADVDLEKCPEYSDLCNKWGRPGGSTKEGPKL